MVLNPDERKVFFQNYIPLLFFASVYGRLLPLGSTTKEFISSSLDVKVESRDIVFNDKNLIEDFKIHNKPFLETASPGFYENIQSGILSKFVVLKQTRSYAVLMEQSSNTFYRTIGITEPIGELLSFIPCVVETAIFNYAGKIVYDGLIRGPIVNIEPNIKKQLLADYKMAKAKNKIITIL